MPINVREIKDLIKLMNENDLTEIEVQFEGTKIKLKKGGDGLVYAEPPRTTGRPHEVAPQVQIPAAEPIDNLKVIKSPIVGTYYQSPSPDADPYIKPGDKVEVGQVVCIVEAMKLMNEIKSEIRGTVKEIHIKNGEPVQFGQALFSVIP